LGTVDTRSEKCEECKHIYPCWKIAKDLRRRCFAEGRYRFGFGKLKINKKHDLRWELEQYEL